MPRLAINELNNFCNKPVLIARCPERIVPPLKPPISLDATMSEFQRFLSRIAAHKVATTKFLYNFFFAHQLLYANC